MNKWKETISILFISACFIGIIILTRTQIKSNQELVVNLPQSTKLHILINGYNFFEEVIFSELFEHKDEIVIEKIKDLFKKRKKRKSNLQELNIDYTKPIELVQIEYKSKNVVVLKFNIDNLTEFDKNINNNHLPIFRIKENGFLILNSPNKNLDKIKEIFKTNQFSYHLKNDLSKQVISRFQNTKLISKSAIQFDKNKILIDISSDLIDNKHTVLCPRGFHFSTSINLNNNLPFKSHLAQIIKFEELEYISLNYLGLKMTDDDLVPAVPRFEAICTYKNSTQADSLIQRVLYEMKSPIDKKEIDEYSLADQRIKFKQLDSNQFVISTLEDDYKLKNIELNPYFTGNPRNLILVENAGWKGLFLELIPTFKATKNLLDDNIQVKTKRTGVKAQQISITFKQKQSLHELLKFALNFI
jgi:hypothetical protein